MRMQIIGGVLTEYQRMAPRAKIRLQILDRLAGLFVNQVIMQLSRFAGEWLFGIELQFEARALDGLDEFVADRLSGLSWACDEIRSPLYPAVTRL